MIERTFLRMRSASVERRARARALALGFRPNEELEALPMNVPDPTVDDSVSEAEQVHTEGGMVTKAKLAVIKTAAEAAVAVKPLSKSEVAMMELLEGVPGRFAKKWVLGLRLSDDDAMNDQLIAAAERDAPAEPRVNAEDLGDALTAAIPNLALIYIGRFHPYRMNNYWGRNDVERFAAIGCLLGAPLVDRPLLLHNRRKNKRDSFIKYSSLKTSFLSLNKLEINRSFKTEL